MHQADEHRMMLSNRHFSRHRGIRWNLGGCVKGGAGAVYANRAAPPQWIFPDARDAPPESVGGGGGGGGQDTVGGPRRVWRCSPLASPPGGTPCGSVATPNRQDCHIIRRPDTRAPVAVTETSSRGSSGKTPSRETHSPPPPPADRPPPPAAAARHAPTLWAARFAGEGSSKSTRALPVKGAFLPFHAVWGRARAWRVPEMHAPPPESVAGGFGRRGNGGGGDGGIPRQRGTTPSPPFTRPVRPQDFQRGVYGPIAGRRARSRGVRSTNTCPSARLPRCRKVKREVGKPPPVASWPMAWPASVHARVPP